MTDAKEKDPKRDNGTFVIGGETYTTVVCQNDRCYYDSEYVDSLLAEKDSEHAKTTKLHLDLAREIEVWSDRSYKNVDKIAKQQAEIARLEAANQKLETELGASRDSVDHWSKRYNRATTDLDEWKLKAKNRQAKLDAL